MPSVCASEQDVARTGSALLAPGTRAAWEHIQRSEDGAAQLLRRFEDYFSNVARNLRRTYLRPFVIVTANMSKAARASVGVGALRGHHPAWPCPREGSAALASISLSVTRGSRTLSVQPVQR